MRTIVPAALLVSAALMAAASCDRPVKPDDLPAGAIRIVGTVQHYSIEGGFWAIRGDDGITYDPMNGLAPNFQRENLRVTVVAKLRNDVVGVHMAGPIVEILDIKAL